jgi:hypothetical protein
MGLSNAERQARWRTKRDADTAIADHELIEARREIKRLQKRIAELEKANARKDRVKKEQAR